MRPRVPSADDWGMRPLIGVTTSEMRRGELATLRRHGEPAHPEMALGITYLQAIERAGGLPVVLPPLPPESVAALLDRLDGVCLSGGPPRRAPAAAPGAGPPAARPPRWRVPLRWPRSRSRRLRRPRAPRGAGPDRAGARRLRARAGAHGRLPGPADPRRVPRRAD